MCRYVDGLATWAPRDPQAWGARSVAGKSLAWVTAFVVTHLQDSLHQQPTGVPHISRRFPVGRCGIKLRPTCNPECLAASQTSSHAQLIGNLRSDWASFANSHISRQKAIVRYGAPNSVAGKIPCLGYSIRRHSPARLSSPATNWGAPYLTTFSSREMWD